MAESDKRVNETKSGEEKSDEDQAKAEQSTFPLFGPFPGGDLRGILRAKLNHQRLFCKTSCDVFKRWIIDKQQQVRPILILLRALVIKGGALPS